MPVAGRTANDVWTSGKMIAEKCAGASNCKRSRSRQSQVPPSLQSIKLLAWCAFDKRCNLVEAGRRETGMGVGPGW